MKKYKLLEYNLDKVPKFQESDDGHLNIFQQYLISKELIKQ